MQSVKDLLSGCTDVRMLVLGLVISAYQLITMYIDEISQFLK